MYRSSPAKSLRTRLFVRPLEERAVPTVFTVTNTNDAGAGSLRQAILDANGDANPDADTINITAMGTVTLTTGEMLITAQNLIVVGPGSGKFTVDANSTGRIFTISNGVTGSSTVSMSGLTVTKGLVTSSGGGGIVVLDENVTLTDVNVTNCKSDGGGAGIFVQGAGAKLTLNNCAITGNVTDDPSLTQYPSGGGLYMQGNALNISGSNISNNQSSLGKTASLASGGGLSFVGDDATSILSITNSQVNNNKAGRGAGIFSFNGGLAKANTLVMTDTTVSGNTAGNQTDGSYGGAGIYAVYFGKITMTKCTISNNNLDSKLDGSDNAAGGGIQFVLDNNGDTTTTGKFGIDITNSVFTGNNSNGRGGAIAAFGVGLAPNTPMNFRGLLIDSNTAKGANYGGGAGIDAGSPGGTILVENSQITNNTGNLGAGFAGQCAATPATNVTIRNSTISGNVTTAGEAGGPGGLGGRGAGIFMAGFAGGTLGYNKLTVTNCTIVSNTSQGNDQTTTASAGGIYTSPGDGVSTGGAVRLESNIILNNKTNSGASELDISSTQLGITAINNIIGVGDNSQLKLDMASSGNIIGTTATPETFASVGLSTMLDFNGATTTKTYALLVGSKALNVGSNPGGLAFDQRGAPFDRTDKISGKTDIGAYEEQGTAPAKFVSLTVNNGATQRSMVTSAAITFDSKVNFTSGAFTLVRDGDLANVSLTATPDVTGKIITLTFNTGPGVDLGGSLADGRFTLTIVAANFTAPGFDGNGDGMAGDNRIIISTGTSGVFRLFGDADGNATVNTADFNAFRLVFGGTSNIFDYDGLGGVGTLDFTQFRIRFGSSV